jgi:predicted metal-dependent phosphoesterase TrpH
MNHVLRLDLHVHSTVSPDSRLPIDQIIPSLGAAGLHGFALTDHNSVDGHRRIAEWRDRYPRIPVIPGVEVTAREGHVLLYGVSECPPRNLPLAELLEWAAPRNAVVALAHPLRWVHGAGRRLAEEAPVQALETRNGRTAELANSRAELVAARRHLAMVGGSDAHEHFTLGRAFTEFPETPETVEELLEMIRQRRSVAGGRSLSSRGRLALALRNAAKRVGRGFRAV